MFQFKAICLLALGALSMSAQAKLIEDGSSFTGTYDIVEPTCYRPSSTSAEKVLSRVRFLGTPAGLYPNLPMVPGTAQPYDGLLIPVIEPHTNNHGSGILTSGYANYLSEKKFISFSKVETPEYIHSQFSEASIVPTTGLLTWTTRRFEGANQKPSEVTVCHYQRTVVLPLHEETLKPCRNYQHTNCMACNEVDPAKCTLNGETTTGVHACFKTCDNH